MVKKMTLPFILLTLSFQYSYTMFSEMDELFKEMDTRLNNMREEMKKEWEEFSSSSNVSYLSLNARDVIIVDHKDNAAVITFHIPGLKNIDAQVEDGVLRITDGDNHQVEILIHGELIQADISYSFKEEKKNEHRTTVVQRYLHFAPTLALPGRVDLSNPQAVKVELMEDRFVVTAPMILKPVHKIPVIQKAPSASEGIKQTDKATETEHVKQETVKIDETNDGQKATEQPASPMLKEVA